MTLITDSHNLLAYKHENGTCGSNKIHQQVPSSEKISFARN